MQAWPAAGATEAPIETHGGYLRSADRDERDQPEDADGAARQGQRADGTDGGPAAEPGPAGVGADPVPGQRPGSGGHAQTAGPRLPAPVASAVQAVLADLADAPFSAPDAERLRELGIDARAAAAAERAGLLRRLPGNILLAPDAPERAARILAGLPQPFTTSDARQALGTTRRTAIPLLEWLDRAGVTRRLADDRRTMREPPGSPRPNGEQ